MVHKNHHHLKMVQSNLSNKAKRRHLQTIQENLNNLSQMSHVSQVSQIGNMAAQFKTESKSVCQLVQCRGKHSCSTHSILHCRVLGSTMRAALYTGNKEHRRRH